MFFNSWKIVFTLSRFFSALIQNEKILFLPYTSREKEKEIALSFRSSYQWTCVSYHELEAERLKGLDPQTIQKSKGLIYFIMYVIVLILMLIQSPELG